MTPFWHPPPPSGYRPYLDPESRSHRVTALTWTPISRPPLPKLPSQNLSETTITWPELPDSLRRGLCRLNCGHLDANVWYITLPGRLPSGPQGHLQIPALYLRKIISVARFYLIPKVIGCLMSWVPRWPYSAFYDGHILTFRYRSGGYRRVGFTRLRGKYLDPYF